jgi:tRNA/rRNA methyltransferase
MPFTDCCRVILVRPQSPENIGLVARCMKNTGFSRLRMVGADEIPAGAFVTAVHAEDILKKSSTYSRLSRAVADLDVIFAATAKKRKNFPALSLQGVLSKMASLSPSSRIGLLFGNERTGLTSNEILHASFCYTIPQAGSQPSYNLASAVLLTLFSLSFGMAGMKTKQSGPESLPRKEQEECFRLILEKLEDAGFVHPANRTHIRERVYDLFGRLTLSAKDRDFLLAVFNKGMK